MDIGYVEMWSYRRNLTHPLLKLFLGRPCPTISGLLLKLSFYYLGGVGNWLPFKFFGSFMITFVMSFIRVFQFVSLTQWEVALGSSGWVGLLLQVPLLLLVFLLLFLTDVHKEFVVEVEFRRKLLLALHLQPFVLHRLRWALRKMSLSWVGARNFEWRGVLVFLFLLI